MPLLNSRQVEEWKAYWMLEPFGHRVDHEMLAQLAVMQAGAAGVKSKLEDFLPSVPKQGEIETDADFDLMFPGSKAFAESLKGS